MIDKLDPARFDAHPAAAEQRTLRQPIGCVGVGRHSGVRVSLTLTPAEPGSGIRFRRSDRTGSLAIEAGTARLQSSAHCLVLAAEDGTRVASIEHVLAALAIADIDNVLIEVNGPEVPAMDGSAQPFVFLIECAGSVGQAAPRAAFVVAETVEVRAGSAAACFLPGEPPGFTSSLGEDAPLGRQTHAVDLARDALRQQIAGARRCGRLAEVEALQRDGLMRGVSTRNTLLVDDDRRLLGEEALRFPDEPARNANLTALGAMRLLPALPRGRYLGHDADHALLARLVSQLARASADPGAAAPRDTAVLVAGIGQ